MRTIPTTGDRYRDTRIATAERDTHGDPQVFPFDNASSDVVRAAMALDPGDHSERAEYLREVAGSVRDHRQSYRRGHTAECRGDLYRGLCH